jgi:hypothetical protein
MATKPSDPRLVRTMDELALSDDPVDRAFPRLWRAYELAELRTAQYIATGHANVEGAQFHETLLEHLAFGNESGVVDLLHVDGDGIAVLVHLWEDDAEALKGGSDG